jgi:hypothetical protein
MSLVISRSVEFFYRSPFAEESTCRKAEGEDIAAARGLILASRDRPVRNVAFQQRADGAMTDEKHSSVATVPCKRPFDGRNDPALRVDRALPSIPACLRMAKEFVRGGLETIGLQKAGGRTIILAHLGLYLYRRASPRRDDLCRLDGLSFLAADNPADRGQPRSLSDRHDTGMSPCRETPLGHGRIWIDLNLRVGEVVANQC